MEIERHGMGDDLETIIEAAVVFAVDVLIAGVCDVDDLRRVVIVFSVSTKSPLSPVLNRFMVQYTQPQQLSCSN